MEFEISLYKVVVPLVSFVFIAYAWSHVLRGAKTIWGALLWTLFWGGIALIALFPSKMRILSTFTGIQDQENAFFAIAIGILIFIVFHLLVKIEYLQQRITEIIRHEALKDAKLNDSKE